MVETRARGHAATLAAEAARAGVPLVVAVGGDDTLNEVVNGLVPLRAESPVTVGARRFRSSSTASSARTPRSTSRSAPAPSACSCSVR
jgi:hypothetical protein